MKAVTNSLLKGHGFFTLLLCSRWRGRVKQLYMNILKMMSIIICIFFTLKDWILCSVNLGSVGFQYSV